ncbi:hypothetical protein [Burkholderia lata]|uniref:hypothetical protein n=1 Tax=Burkholderia lata (strain ATCC 17760 / DSM 23089 / LMG 22485 / NCIMB 9086 / R18194 / 383) TaxID=482957 RepID=UPI0015818EB3|nr:hypothetical protein [Burkholderia lata]
MVALLRLVFGDRGFWVARFRAAKGPIAENQSTDDWFGGHQPGAFGLGAQAFCLQTKLNIWKLIVIFMK